jgi:hypothetical protein
MSCAKKKKKALNPFIGLELQAIRDKAKRFDGLIEQIFSIEVSAPRVMGNYISFALSMDAGIMDEEEA